MIQTINCKVGLDSRNSVKDNDTLEHHCFFALDENFSEQVNCIEERNNVFENDEPVPLDAAQAGCNQMNV